jgi:hypothetical protein
MASELKDGWYFIKSKYSKKNMGVDQGSLVVAMSGKEEDNTSSYAVSRNYRPTSTEYHSVSVESREMGQRTIRS